MFLFYIDIFFKCGKIDKWFWTKAKLFPFLNLSFVDLAYLIIHGYSVFLLLSLMRALLATLTRAVSALRCASFFDGVNQDHDYYLAHAASQCCLETCFSKKTTEGQLLSAELFSLLCMCVLAARLWPTDPEQQHGTRPFSALPPTFNSLVIIHHKWPNLHFAHFWGKHTLFSYSVWHENRTVSYLAPNFKFAVWYGRNIPLKNSQQKCGCLTEMHANAAIKGGRKLYSVAVSNSLVQWNKALCCYVKVSACNCSGCFEGFIIYIFLCFSEGACEAAIPAGSSGAERCPTKWLYAAQSLTAARSVQMVMQEVYGRRASLG